MANPTVPVTNPPTIPILLLCTALAFTNPSLPKYTTTPKLLKLRTLLGFCNPTNVNVKVCIGIVKVDDVLFKFDIRYDLSDIRVRVGVVFIDVGDEDDIVQERDEGRRS